MHVPNSLQIWYMHADTMNYEYSEVNEILLYIRLRYSQVYTVYEGYEYCILTW